MNQQIKHTLHSLVPLFLLLLASLIQWIFNKSYIQAIVTGTLYSFALMYITWVIIQATKKIYTRRHEFKKSISYLFLGVLVTLSTVMVGVTGLQVLQMVHPINIYTVSEDNDPEQGVIYVTHNTECEYCNVSKESMLRAVRAYGQGHPTKVRVVNLHNDTKLAKKLDEMVDHYGSIVKIDKDGTLHETMYTLSDLDGNPVPNTPGDIYERMVKVSKND